MNDKARYTSDQYFGWPIQALFLFGLMTSFPKCTGTSFTLRGRFLAHKGCKPDGVEDDGRTRAEGEVCGGRVTRGA